MNSIQLQNKVMNWFAEYQGKESDEKMQKLYKNLIKEEISEYKDAQKEKDLNKRLELELDAIWDIFVVVLGYQYFGWNQEVIMENIMLSTQLFNTLKMEWNRNEAFNEVILEINESNFTKSKVSLENWEKSGKIIKWPNFKEPNFQKIIKKYNIKLQDA